MKNLLVRQQKFLKISMQMLAMLGCFGLNAQANEISNPGFENDLLEWLYWSGQVATTDEAATGVKALKIGPEEGGMGQAVSVVAGKKYILSASAKVYSENVPAFIGVLGSGYEKYMTFNNTSGFETKSIEFTVPGGVSSLNAYVWNNGGDYIIADDLSLEIVSDTGGEEISGAVYVDCSLSTNGDGSLEKPLNNLADVETNTYTAGASILLKRNTICNGNLTLSGSGVSGNPIMLSAYGTGSLPIISAGSLEYAIKIQDESYWRIENIETTGGTTYGILITSDAEPVNYFRLRNLVVRDVISTEPMANKGTGLVVVGVQAGNNATAEVNDVIIDNVTAYNTNRWAGIIVGSPSYIRSKNATVRNSEVYDIYGDGIIVFSMDNARIESSVAYRTGIEPVQTIGTPNAIWTWNCVNCVVEFNEAYENDSPGLDGGAFDIDWGNVNNILQYNYGHDNSAYCIAVFGAEGERFKTINSIIRYNVCSNNGTQDVWQNREIAISTWNNGLIDGLQIYNNTFYTTRGLIRTGLSAGSFVGELPRFFKNNIVYSTVNAGTDLPTSLDSDYNLWYVSGGSYDSGEPNSIHNDPKMNEPTYSGNGMPTTQFQLMSDSPAIDSGVDICFDIANCSMGGRDFFGNPLQGVDKYDIGAHEYRK